MLECVLTRLETKVVGDGACLPKRHPEVACNGSIVY